MTRKALNVFVELNVHAVTCPGVWLSARGRVALRVAMLGTSVRTSRVPPVFPLLFHSKFIFQKTLWDVCRLPELEEALARQTLVAQLVQGEGEERLLATFETSLLELLFPVTFRPDLACGVDVDLLMDASPSFPGILAPKIEVSTKTTIEEVTHRTKPSKFVINPKMVSSKSGKQEAPRGQSSSQPRYCTRGRRRQRAARKPGEAEPPQPGPWVSASGQLFSADTYHQLREDGGDEGCSCRGAAQGRWEAGQSACRVQCADGSCQVCLAYNKYFNPSADRKVHFPQTSKKSLSPGGSEHFHMRGGAGCLHSAPGSEARASTQIPAACRSPVFEGSCCSTASRAENIPS
ncbi:spermatogenesis associated 6-like protein isoform X2 [Bacillus rossius redtenbacheri]|uniref:spermatogenesis associated 6-like protein isoform X2 n=1 Tax=Bacillus rossius redtenbacheri TaxID=93214 RepID=UPI002FDCD1CE